jgi:hypothetical protein
VCFQIERRFHACERCLWSSTSSQLEESNDGNSQEPRAIVLAAIGANNLTYLEAIHYAYRSTLSQPKWPVRR